MIQSRLGELEWNRNGERGGEGGRVMKGWWKSVVEGAVGREGTWFWDRVQQKLGDGQKAVFGTDSGQGRERLKRCFQGCFSYEERRKVGRNGSLGRR